MKIKSNIILAFLAGASLFSVSCKAGADTRLEPKPTEAYIKIFAEPEQRAAEFGYEGQFWPQSVVVAEGATVTWNNTDYKVHTVVSDDGLFKARLELGQTFNHTFSEKGDFRYHDEEFGFFGWIYVE